MRTVIAAVTLVLWCLAVPAFAGSAKTAKDANVLAKEIEVRIKKKPNETVRVESAGCQFSIEFIDHQVKFLLPLGGSEILEADSSDGVVVINSKMVRKVKDRAAEPFERLYLRFDRDLLDQTMSHFQAVIKACET